MRYAYFDYFRAIAIILVVAGHSYGAWERDTTVEYALVVVITGATAPFVFISGFFFHEVFYKKFNYSNFLKVNSKRFTLPILYLLQPTQLRYSYIWGTLHFIWTLLKIRFLTISCL